MAGFFRFVKVMGKAADPLRVDSPVFCGQEVCSDFDYDTHGRPFLLKRLSCEPIVHYFSMVFNDGRSTVSAPVQGTTPAQLSFSPVRSRKNRFAHCPHTGSSRGSGTACIDQGTGSVSRFPLSQYRTSP